MGEFNNVERGRKQLGQAMVEYALIMVLLALAVGLTLAMTGPAIGNVFCNVVDNLGGVDLNGNCGSAAQDLVALGGDPSLFWATVTWVAQHPQKETPFPTPIRRAPAGAGAVIPPTNTPSFTPTKTYTPTPTNTPTSTYTFTAGPSPTNGDVGFTVPYGDQINNPEWWRLDTGDFMGYSNWSVQWYDNFTGATCSPYCNIGLNTPTVFNNALGTDINTINYDWGSGYPSGAGLTDGDNWGADFTRSLDVIQTAMYKFTLGGNNYATLYLDGTPFLSQQANDTSTTSTSIQVTKGGHTLRLVYAEGTINASVSLHVDRLTINPDDPLTNLSACTWGRSGDTNNPVSVTWMFDENPGSDTWSSGQTCYLEMRGYVDLTGKSNPIFSFWDIWDFRNAGAAGFTAELQVSPYVKDASGFLKRNLLNWQPIASRTFGTANYNWTRTQVDLTSLIPSLTSTDASQAGNPSVVYATFRFVIGSTNPGAAPFRWYIDDLQLINDPSPSKTFTVDSATTPNNWDMNLVSQMNDFVYDGDSYDNPGVTNTIGPRRWSLTSTYAHGGMAWDDSPAGNYQAITGLSPASPTGAAQARIHFLEFKYPVDLTTSAPAADTEGDTGDPLLTFWQAYDIAPNASIRVQYYDGTTGWTDIPNQGVLIDYTVPSGSGRTSLTMQPVEINLTNIPAAIRATPVRLRFALYVDAAATSFGDGWHIDDIRIQRESSSPYFAYPFIDDAENATFSADSWDAIGGRWNTTTAKNGAENTSTAYADSPGGLYDASDIQSLQLHFAIDLLHDTVANVTDLAGRPAAIQPQLTFWHQRYLGPGVVFSVDLWTPYHNWQSIWSFDSDTTAPSFNTQTAWERADIDLETAIAAVTGTPWSTIASNGIDDDDDIKIRFRVTSGSGAVADGVYVDQIRIQDASTASQRLWATGDGEYLDSIETESRSFGAWDTNWDQRWYAGGRWNTTSTSGYTHSGSKALADSPAGNYSDNSYSVIEFRPMIDLSDPSTPTNPIMTFWTRYQIGSDDTFQVQISRQDVADTAQGYDKVGGWSAWSTRPMMVGVPAPGDALTGTQVDTWLRGQVNLASFVGGKIRVRFVLSVPNNTTQADGIYIDDVKFSYTTSQIAVPMIDNAVTTTNWITEGTWGLGQDYFLGNGASDLGLSAWTGTYFDCEQLTAADCGDSGTYTSILAANANFSPLNTPVYSGPKLGPENVTTGIDFNWGTTHRPFYNPVTGVDIVTDTGYNDTFAARWTRSVDLQAGATYNVYTVSDDGVRLTIDNMCGTNISPDLLSGANPANCPTPQKGVLIENWGNHPATLDYYTFLVSSTTALTNRTLTLEYYENTGDAIIILNATSSSFSFTDSPNTPYGTTFDVVNAIFPGNSSLMLNGFFNFPAGSTPYLEYKRLYDLKQNETFYVEISTDGGFNWTQVGSETVTNDKKLPPSTYWLQRHIDLVAPTDYRSQNVIVRFRLDTRTASLATGGSGDGVYLTDIQVND